MAAGTTYTPIATTTLGSATSSITFSSIPSTYTDLKLVFVATSSVGNTARIQFNSDTGNNYSNTEMYGDGTTTGTSSTTNSAYCLINNGTQLSTTIPTMTIIDIFSYSGSTDKTLLSVQSADKNGSGAVGVVVNLWRSTSAISTIYLYTSTGNLDIGTTATIWGIKNA